MKTYSITAAEEPENLGVRVTFVGLPGRYASRPGDLTWLFKRYDYEKDVPPFFSEGIAESKCFTLPWAIYLWIYDECQTSDHLHDGDELILDYEGQRFVTIVNTWPRCEAAQFAEDAFRVERGLPTLAEAERAQQAKEEADRRYAGGW